MSATIQALDMSGTNAALFAALAKAQQQARTVGKDGNNAQGRYKYSTAEAMVRGARAAMADTGLAILSTWTQEPADVPQDIDIGKQFVCATVVEHFVLTHADGGYIQGRAELDAIASRGRSPEKAVAAAATYMHGFVLRHLLNLDRAEEGEHAVDRRNDGDFVPRGRPAPQQRPPNASPEWKAAYAKYQDAIKTRRALIESNGITAHRDAKQIIMDTLGTKTQPQGRDITPEQWGMIERAVRDEIDDMELVAATAATLGGKTEAAE